MRSAGRELAVEEEGMKHKWVGMVYHLLDTLGQDIVNGGSGRDYPSVLVPVDSGVGGGRRGDEGRVDNIDNHCCACGRISMAIYITLSIQSKFHNKEARLGGECNLSAPC